ncbi:response regulator transcription factor [Nibrella viscosa]|uniref:Response regulator transcription factor n=1 Tax=Nibrella viscosa TaxID=1084524 RepID=A0ABP8KVP4_9BACT
MRLLLADDHPLLLDGLRSVLEELPDVELLPPVSNGHQLLDYLHRQPVDLLLLDLNMPKIDGLTALKTIVRQYPLLKIIVFTSYTQPQYIRKVQMLGANGYLLKTTDAVTLKKAVSAVATGQNWFPETPTVSTGTVDDPFNQKYQLTRREIEIIRLIARGLTSRQISERLFVSEFTINAHRRNIARKTGADTPVALLTFAQEQGLLS